MAVGSTGAVVMPVGGCRCFAELKLLRFRMILHANFAMVLFRNFADGRADEFCRGFVRGGAEFAGVSSCAYAQLAQGED